MINRVIMIVLDSVGIGALPDARSYGDEGADTLGHIVKAMGEDFDLPRLARLGLFNLVRDPARALPAGRLSGSYGRMAASSPAKDTTAGHWELAGLALERPFPTYPHGFPAELIHDFERRIGTRTLGNVTASGTEIIARLGDEHLKTGFPIVYTSADSVFQIAAHEESFGLERLYDICRIARGMLTGDHAVGRVIARPFTGTPGRFARTANRRDYSLDPPGETLLDRIVSRGGSVTAVGKIEDIFNRRGITRALHSHANAEGMRLTLQEVRTAPPAVPSLIFTNLVDFDMLWGHRRDLRSYAKGLQEFDEWLPELLGAMRSDDVLFVTADHGCDPSFAAHTDHTREYVPLLACGNEVMPGIDLGARRSFADAAQTIADLFGLGPVGNGRSFTTEIIKSCTGEA